MNIVIFGANGPTGRLLTRQALNEGHRVTAVTRHPEAFPFEHEQLRVVKGDVLDAASVESVMVGQDAALSVIGVPYSFKPITVYSQGIANILRAMQRSGTRRLVSVSSGGTNTQDDRREGFVFGRIIKPIIGKTLYDDMRRMEHLLTQSDVDWTIVRPAQLVRSATVTPYQVAEGDYMVDQETSTSRADLADFLLRQVTDGRYIRKAVAIATPSRVRSEDGPGEAVRGVTRWIQVITLVASLYNVGTIVLAQANWGLWRYIGRKEFPAYHRAYFRDVQATILPMWGLAGIGALLQTRWRPLSVSPFQAWLGVLLQIAIFGATAAWWGREQRRLEQVWLPERRMNPLYERLLRTHWIRVGLIVAFAVLQVFGLIRGVDEAASAATRGVGQPPIRLTG